MNYLILPNILMLLKSICKLLTLKKNQDRNMTKVMF